MIILIHNRSGKIARVLNGKAAIEVESTTCVDALWELSQKFPDKIIAWCEENLQNYINIESWNEIFHHDLVMASYAVNTLFLSPNIGYVDQSPFINIKRDVRYGTWLMSSDIGGIKGELLITFQDTLGKEKNFDFLLNSVAKLGQLNGLFCYSDPRLIDYSPQPLQFLASKADLFRFTHQHYKPVWTIVLLWCFIRYEQQFPIMSYLRALRSKNFFGKEIKLSNFNIQTITDDSFSNSVDVLIPTMGRHKHLLQVLRDLKVQTLLPKKVIIVEQDPDPLSTSSLLEIETKDWPFRIDHHFIHQTGACNARNLALKNVTADWIFFADDDIRIAPDLLQNAIKEIKRLRLTALNMNCKQEGEETIFYNIKQWGSFGSGTSMVKSSFAKKCKFDLVYEHGYGEDADYGRQLRNVGCDIIYHPDVEILHLKAPVGGFRNKPKRDPALEHLRPKPSPTLMIYAMKYYTLQQKRGFKTSMFLKYYNKQPVKNPVLYIRKMNERWKKSYQGGITLLHKTENFKS